MCCLSLRHNPRSSPHHHPAASLVVLSHSMDPAQEKLPGRFRRLALVIGTILRTFSIRSPTIDPSWNSKPLEFGRLSSPTKHRQMLSLQQLSQPETMQSLTHRIQQRLLVQPNIDVTSTTSETVKGDTAQVQWLSGDAQNVLINSPWTRTLQDIKLVQEKLQCYEIFQDYPPTVQESICRVCWYQRIEAGRVIFREGQQPSSFYLILTGSVKFLKRTSAMCKEDMTKISKSGESFGGDSIYKRQQRSSTCVADEATELLVISKSDYLDLSLRQSCLSYQKTKHLEFCKTVSVLKYWPINELQTKHDMCRVKYFKLNSVVVKDSRKCDWVCIVMTGSCRVVKRFVDSNEFMQHTDSKIKKVGLPDVGELSRSKTVTALMGGTNKLKQMEEDNSKFRHSNSVSDLQRQEATISSLHPVSVPVQKQFLVQLQILHPKDIFGLSSLLYSTEPSITLVSNGADVVMLSKEFIMKHMSEPLKVKLQKQVIQYPSEEAMRKRIRNHHTWNTHKQFLKSK